MNYKEMLSLVVELNEQNAKLENTISKIEKLSKASEFQDAFSLQISSLLAAIASLGGDINQYLRGGAGGESPNCFKTVSLWSANEAFIPVYLHFRAKNANIKYFLSNDENLVVNTGAYGFRVSQRFTLYTKVKTLSETDAIIVVGSSNASLKSNIESVTGGKVLFIRDILYNIFMEKALLETLSKVPVPILFIENPLSRNVKNPSEHEKTVNNYEGRLREAVKSSNFESEFNDPVFLQRGYTKEYISDVLETFRFKSENGIYRLVDKKGKYSNVVDGHRVTVGVPSDPVGTVYMFGPSTMYGPNTDDENTLPSLVQKILNEKGYNYAVKNCSNYAGGDIDWQAEYIEQMLEQEEFKGNDIVLTMLGGELTVDAVRRYFPLLDLQALFDRPHDHGEVFTGIYHLCPEGYKIIAPPVFEYLTKNYIDQNSVKAAAKAEALERARLYNVEPKHEGNKDNIIDDDLKGQLSQYISDVKDLLPNKYQTGAMVVNCNPFTLGHRYLIETASKQVAHLFVFVVEEDKSFFPFNDRLELVKKGTADLDNVTVCPSGKFMISTLTFEAYSSKETLSNSVVDPSMDVKLFASKIAPALGISVRFVGEEPLCNVTNQYNQCMMQMFPKYGLELVVIPRKDFGGQPISASRVRLLLKENKFDEIEKIVPQTTLEYLKAMVNM